MKQKTLVLFDFDGTLIKGDSLPRFLLFAVPFHKLLTGSIVLAIKFLWTIVSGKWSNEKGKELLVTTFFAGSDEVRLRGLGASFYQKKLPGILNPIILERLRDYRNAGATVALVSASPDLWLRPFCDLEGIVLICTELQVLGGKFTGRLSTPNCNRAEKVRRILQVFEPASFEKIVAFGNSSGDAQMLAFAHEAWLVKKGIPQLITPP